MTGTTTDHRAATDLDLDMPADVDAERAVLGALMWDARLVDDMADTLTGDDFWQPAHEAVWHTIVDLHRDGHTPDPITVAAELERRQQLDLAGGRLALAEMTEAAIPANAPDHALVVQERAVQRRTMQAAARIRDLASRGGNPQALVDASRAALDALDPSIPARTASIAEVLPAVVDGIGDETVAGLPTPWPDLNDAIGGLQAGRVYTIGARPGVGKSLVGQALAVHWSATHRRRVLLATCEMPAREVTLRMLSADSQVFHGKLVSGALTQVDEQAVARSVLRMRDSHQLLEVCDEPTQSVASIRQQARALAKRGQLGLVVVDYLQLLEPPPSGRRDRNREQEVAQVARGFKRLAMELDVPVVLMSQLNRQMGVRADKRPTLFDLRESGAIEQDSDVVLLLHEPDPDGAPNELELIVAKQRGGSLTSIRLLRRGWVSSIGSSQWVPSDVGVA